MHMVSDILSLLKSWSIQEICICPGSRNAPLIESLKSSSEFQITTMHEEREAAFYALQKTKSQKIATTIITTSGTASAEMFPAVIEAYYQSCPLVVISADRPKNYRNTGSPQSIEQNNLFGTYAQCWDLDKDSDMRSFKWDQSKPLHINLCFDEPLIDSEIVAIKDLGKQALNETAFTSEPIRLDCKSPLFLISELESVNERETVKELLTNNPVPFVLEALSGLDIESPLKIDGPEKLITNLLEENYFDAIVRIGAVPVSAFWRRLESSHVNIPVYSFTKHPFSGLARESKSFDTLNIEFSNISHDEDLKNRILEHKNLVHSLTTEYPLSEPSLMLKLHESLPSESPVYLGNSSPIRNFQYFASNNYFLKVAANRGANGIDGQVSSFLGFARDNKKSIAIIGDQTLMYGESALHFIKSSDDVHIICINNQGGQIFSRMYDSEIYQNPHNKSFKHLAQYHGLNYKLAKDTSHFNLESGPCLYEITPSNEQTASFWRDYDSFRG